LTTWKTRGLAEWIEGGTAFLSVVFSWLLPQTYQRAVWLRAMGYHVRAGGPAVALNPDYLAEVAELGGQVDALPHHHDNATFTSRGCPRTCPWCPVPTVEGGLVELTDWEPASIVLDPNLLATSLPHFDRVMDKLKGIPGVDFLQGLDTRFFTEHHAERIAELDLHAVRFAWDNTRTEASIRRAIAMARAAGIGVKAIKVYVLIGYRDTPEDALYRCETLKRELGVDPRVMRYQPLDALERNSYVDSNWTETELANMVRYWWRTRWLGAIPFDEYKRAPAERPWLRR
jgi:hypothetical protein